MPRRLNIEQHSVSLNGARVAYTVAGGAGTPVILVHGGASDRGDWAGNIPVLATTFRVYALDLIGYGESGRPHSTYTLRHFSDSIADFMESLGIGRACLIGHSLGARACLEVAVNAPDAVAKLVLIAPIGFGQMSRSGALLQRAIRAFLMLSGKPLPYPDLEVSLDPPDSDHLSEVVAPTLVVWGRRDLYLPHRHTRRIAEVLPRPRVEILHNRGHAPHKEAPDEFNRLVLDFLATEPNAAVGSRSL